MKKITFLLFFLLASHAANLESTLKELGFKRDYRGELGRWIFTRNEFVFQFQAYNHIFTAGGMYHALKKPLLPLAKGVIVTDEDMAAIIRLATAYERQNIKKERNNLTKAQGNDQRVVEKQEETQFEVVSDRLLIGRGNQNKIHSIFIDPGHGGEDPGASGYGFKEKDLALSLSKKLEKELKDSLPSVGVKLTRNRDKFVSLEARCHIANESLRHNQNGLMISMHLNSWIDTNAAGFEVYYLDHQKTAEDARVRALMKRENINLKNKDPLNSLNVFEKIFGRLEIIQYQKESKFLADAITGSVSAYSRDYTKVKKSRSELFFVLKGALMPAVLVEVGFISNKRDLEYLVDEAKQKKMIQGIAKGVKEFVHTFNRSDGFRKDLF